MRNRLLILLLVAALLLIFNSAQNARSSESNTLNEDLYIRAGDFVVEEGSGLFVTDSGLVLADSASSGTYTSTPLKAPFPFNAVVPQWMADLSESSSIEVRLRTGNSATELGPWQEIHTSHDWTLPEDEATSGEMFFVPAEDGTHTTVQVMISLSREDALDQPLLRELRLTFIDSTVGPTVDEMIALQKAMDESEAAEQPAVGAAPDGYPKPFVISRAVWCTDPRCNYSDGLQYQPVTHLILHHTVGVPAGDAAAQMRAYWSYHAFTKEWGDIGYNFVIDLDGNIFEGHLGGDDVIGTHAGNANSGSMGLAMIGSYSVNKPSAAVKESIIDMFAWKADQRDIDVFDASDTLPNLNWGLPHMMGHRDVYGTTECPGGAAHSIIPEIRDEVASRIGLESPHIYVDELSSSFIKSSANWYVANYQCGHNTHAWYTWSTTDPGQAANWGEWRPVVPLNGRYKIEAHIPYCKTDRNETNGAHYTINHAYGSSDVVISHQDNAGLWASLGEYDLQAGTGNVIHLTDLTTTDNGLGLWFDSLRLLQVEVLPAAVAETPGDKAWLNDRQVRFKWTIENPQKVIQTKLQVATDEQFKSLVVNMEWPSAVESATHTFDRDYAKLFWRVVLLSDSGGTYQSPTSDFGIDSEPPVSSVKQLVWLAWSEQYKVSWGGNDALNYVQYYIIEYRAENGSWKTWLNDVSATAAQFTPPVSGQVYEFRSQAVDSLGNVEAPHATADTSTKQALSFDHAIILPVIQSK